MNFERFNKQEKILTLFVCWLLFLPVQVLRFVSLCISKMHRTHRLPLRRTRRTKIQLNIIINFTISFTFYSQLRRYTLRYRTSQRDTLRLNKIWSKAHRRRIQFSTMGLWKIFPRRETDKTPAWYRWTKILPSQPYWTNYLWSGRRIRWLLYIWSRVN